MSLIKPIDVDPTSPAMQITGSHDPMCTCIKKTTTDGLGYSDASNCEMHKGQFDEINKLHEALFVYMRRHGVVRATVFIPEEATKSEEVQLRLYRKE